MERGGKEGPAARKKSARSSRRDPPPNGRSPSLGHHKKRRADATTTATAAARIRTEHRRQPPSYRPPPPSINVRSIRPFRPTDFRSPYLSVRTPFVTQPPLHPLSPSSLSHSAPPLLPFLGDEELSLSRSTPDYVHTSAGLIAPFDVTQPPHLRNKRRVQAGFTCTRYIRLFLASYSLIISTTVIKIVLHRR